jgi:hypothetical protein
MITEEHVLATIEKILASKIEHNKMPDDLVTFNELLMDYSNEIKKHLNALHAKKVIKVGNTMNDKYIKLRDSK